MKAKECPYCKEGILKLVDSDDSLHTYECAWCDKITQIEKDGENWKLLIDGAVVASGLIPLLEFLGISDYDEFLDTFGL